MIKFVQETKMILKNRGFTLMEMLVIISIIGMLSSVILVSVHSAREKARYAVAVADLNQIAKAAALYYNEHETYPPDVWTDEPPAGLTQYLGGAWPKGPWPGSYFDWDYWTDPTTWATPAPPGTTVAQISLRFCTDVSSTDCVFPDEPWAAGFTNRSSVYYCIQGPCRSHSNLPINAPGKCVNCGT